MSNAQLVGKLVAKHVLTVKSSASALALQDLDKRQFIEAVGSILGDDYCKAEAAAKAVAREELVLFKLCLLRDSAPVWDVWIDAAMEDGLVFEAGSTTEVGILISVARVVDPGQMEQVCGEISEALYRSGFEAPSGVKWEKTPG